MTDIRPAARATLRLTADDNVVVALSDLPAGFDVPDEPVHTVDAVPSGHKLATRAIPAGEPVLKYGQVIGVATVPIAPGERCRTSISTSRRRTAVRSAT